MGKDRVSPLFDGQHQWRVGWIQFSRDAGHPGKVRGKSLLTSWLVIDGKEAFLQLIPLAQEGNVLDPALQHEHFFRFQVVFPAQQQVATMHLEGFALRLD